MAKDKVELLKALKDGSDNNGPFASYADALMFAAMIGIRNNKRLKLHSVSYEGLDRVPQDQFRDPELMSLLSICDLQSFSVLADDSKLDRQRVEVFQEYANGGLEIIGQKISGSVDYTDQILLMLEAEIDNRL
ncbi:DNA phosphorothioation-associated protein 4 [Acaryochloris sp. IP29b_bin.148]|uniref:DNA phosphorothioation-associated protein 4 n=1 Tax=Acaryochloris sp. IP29b_bin.148 TaxID=2969218 RepID=UPI0026201425|nr:DNA phosphorothioation-associated protein 4 [Acaryochloris sp. IP29b_bin.148]